MVYNYTVTISVSVSILNLEQLVRSAIAVTEYPIDRRTLSPFYFVFSWVLLSSSHTRNHDALWVIFAERQDRQGAIVHL